MFFDRLRGALPAIGLALVVVVVTVAFFVGRTTAPEKAAAGPTPTAPVGGSGPVVPVSGGGIPGAPTRLNSLGIPVGYPHTQAGAISACGNYISAIQGLGSRNKAKLDAIFGAIGSGRSSAVLTQRILSADSKTAKNYGVTSLQAPEFRFDLRVVGYKVQKASRDAVTVSVWSAAGVGVLGSDDELAPQQRWGTDLCTVAWSRQDWRLSDATDGPDGPSITDRAAEGIQRFAFAGGQNP